MSNVELSITPRTQALILRYEHDRPVIEDAARQTLTREGLDGYRDVACAVLHPDDKEFRVRSLRGEEWAGAFLENEQFASALISKEKELGLDHLPVHIFGFAPLELMLHLASCLPRRRLRVYQQSESNEWSLGFDRTLAAAPEDFLVVEGLPKAKQGGSGVVALVVEVTHAIGDQALEAFRKKHGANLLAEVRVRPVRGPGPASIQSPSEVSRAVEQLRGVLGDLHERLGGATSVLLAMGCSASFAAALGTAVNVNTQLPLWLHHYDGGSRQYIPVQEMKAGRAAPLTAKLTPEQLSDATKVLAEVRKVHQELVAWMSESAQQWLVDALDGKKFLRSVVEDVPSMTPIQLYRHVGGKWGFEVGMLLGLKALRERVGTEDWKECIRLFMVHEVFHVNQGGLTSYTFSGSGRTGFVLEAADFDADAIAVEAMLAWRKSKQARTVEDDGETRTMESIVWNAMESLRVFEPEKPVRTLSERRLRRYLIWLFQVCRLNALVLVDEGGPAPKLERATVEIAGLKMSPDLFETYAQQRLGLLDVDPGEELITGIYFQRKLVRDRDGHWVKRVLEALSRWDEKSREDAQEDMKRLFEEFFNRHRELIQSR
ncbi:SAVED domain-containing protein [Myxococcus sp. K38C18041901]|uniref:SAVED domain-containing protein n=1 Tax=Myxococcus guangdongensis TaxID=2906760 RepID=UPI0020A8200A|nr:SAVED domain-containing protein [Myxococcus guangdongensis]MCP3062633.1 SAVED domain-containing protein [Myxococcus guangdongensis]